MIIIDKHEPEEIEKELIRLGLSVKRETLQVGDYVIGDLGVERKSVGDFLNSIFQARIFEQLKNLKDAYERQLLIVEGLTPTRYSQSEQKRYIAYFGAISAIILGYNIPVVTTLSFRDTAFLLSQLYKRHYLKKPSLKPLPPKHEDINEVKEEMLCCIPRIGRVKAKALLEKFKYNMRKIANADATELSSVLDKGALKSFLAVFADIDVER